MIGIIGGVGPYAGVNLVSKILDNTLAHSDQEHLPLLLLSIPGQISDRTEFLEGSTAINPGIELARLTRLAIDCGASVIGIPCNTAHASVIFSHVVQSVADSGSSVCLINMIEEVIRFLQEGDGNVQSVGVISTNGTYQTELYKKMLFEARFNTIVPDEMTQRGIVHQAIYGTDGLKTCSNPVTERASNAIKTVARELVSCGAQVIILACSELSLVFPDQDDFEGVPLIDSTVVLARALIKHSFPEKLRV